MTSEKDKQTQLSIPTQCNMPDLSELYDKNVLGVLLNLIFRDTPTEYKSRAFVINFVRITDRVIREYTNARVAFLVFVNNQPSPYFSPAFQAIGHFETLVNSLWRASLFVNCIKKNSETSRIIDVRINNDVTKRIEEIRHAIEHLDEKLAKGKIGQGEPWFILLKNDSIELSGYEISHRELADFIRTLYSIAQDLIKATYGKQS